MREIKFRGYSEELKKWIFGYLIITEISEIFHDGKLYKVVPESVGQFTGLKDKNGVEIYERDIQKQTVGTHYWIYVVKSIGGQFGNQLFSITKEHNFSVDEDEEIYTYEKIIINGDGTRNSVKSGKDVEVIGNIYENKDLIK